MNNCRYGSILLALVCLFFMRCSKPGEIVEKPKLFITLKDANGNAVVDASVRLYKNAQDTGITQFSDTSGIVIFRNLDPEVYYWFAEKGCATNRISQSTLKRPLVENAILYGYSVLYETGTLIITNTSAEQYKVSDSMFNITLPADTIYTVYPVVGSRTIHSQKVTTPGMGKDTVITAKCGDTSFLVIPY